MKDLKTWAPKDVKPIELESGIEIMKYYAGQEFMSADNSEFLVTFGSSEELCAIVTAGMGIIYMDADDGDKPLLILFKNGEQICIYRLSRDAPGRVVLHINKLKSYLRGKLFNFPTREEVLAAKKTDVRLGIFNMKDGTLRDATQEQLDKLIKES